jgi:hypothetical protein
MLRWRHLILALVLLLSLPLRFADAALAPCHAHPAGMDAAASAQTQHPMTAHARAALPGTTVALASPQCSHAGVASMADHHASGVCGMNAPCCTGALPATAPRVSAPALSLLLFAIRLVSDPASPFLTDGVDRPPRPSLV